MNRDKQRLLDYLNHILESIARIERYVEGFDHDSFLNNELIQDAVIRNMEIIGEASRNVERYYPDFANQHSDVPFSIAYEMRNALAHGYFKVDFEVVWKTIERDLPELENSLERLVKKLVESK
ncbi:MAG TPA: DUF86 domain-containing protein [Dehalococcoidia bacterium]|nr:DUF86 domain-containing protein [Dehalococcoidia bacterium]